MSNDSQRRQQILEEMSQLDRMQRGHLSKQYFKKEDENSAMVHGPYYVFQRWLRGKNICRRVSAKELDAVQAEVKAWKRFKQLADEFVTVTERMTLEEKSGVESKKNSRRSAKRVIRKRKTSWT